MFAHAEDCLPPRLAVRCSNSPHGYHKEKETFSFSGYLTFNSNDSTRSMYLTWTRSFRALTQNFYLFDAGNPGNVLKVNETQELSAAIIGSGSGSSMILDLQQREKSK